VENSVTEVLRRMVCGRLRRFR